MKNKGRNLLVLFKNKFSSKQEADCLQMILLSTESPEKFCIAHELVDRNRITSKNKTILKESRLNPLRTFRFLINKN